MGILVYLSPNFPIYIPEAIYPPLSMLQPLRWPNYSSYLLIMYYLKASRAQILKKAAEYIIYMRKKNNSHQQDIEDLKRQNTLLEAQSKYIF